MERFPEVKQIVSDFMIYCWVLLSTPNSPSFCSPCVLDCLWAENDYSLFFFNYFILLFYFILLSADPTKLKILLFASLCIMEKWVMSPRKMTLLVFAKGKLSFYKVNWHFWINWAGHVTRGARFIVWIYGVSVWVFPCACEISWHAWRYPLVY